VRTSCCSAKKVVYARARALRKLKKVALAGVFSVS